MSEEAVVDVVVENPATEEVVEVNPTEEAARAQGWVSKEEWEASGRDGGEWRPAKEFVERGELYKSIHSTKRELKQTQAALDSLARHHQYVFQKAYQDAMRDLRAEKRAAIRNEDMAALEEIETEIEQVQADHAKAAQAFVVEQQAVRAAGTVPPAFEAWAEKNSWYQVDKQLRDEADAIGFVYLNNGGSREGLLNHVEREVKRKFPEKFGVKKSAPNAVAGVNRTSRAGRAESVQLTELENKIMNDLVKAGVMTKEQYIKELKGK